MFTASFSVLSKRYPTVVYVNSSTEGLLTSTSDGHFILKTVRGAVNINY
jgi:hypothetical protein